jgi:hypothetical protein
LDEGRHVIEILRDPISQFIVAVIAVIVTIAVYLSQRSRKELSYEVLWDFPLIGIRNVEEGLQLLFKGRPLRNAFLFQLRLVNSGNTPIVPADFERPLSMNFGKDVILLNVEVEEANPENLKASLLVKNQSIVLNPVLLNSEDSITIRCMLSEYDGNIEVDARIAGVKKVEERLRSYSSWYRHWARNPEPRPSSSWKMWNIIIGSFFVGIAGALYGGGKDPIFDPIRPYSPTLLILAIAFGIYFISRALLSDRFMREMLMLELKRSIRVSKTKQPRTPK